LLLAIDIKSDSGPNKGVTCAHDSRWAPFPNWCLKRLVDGPPVIPLRAALTVDEPVAFELPAVVPNHLCGPRVVRLLPVSGDDLPRSDPGFVRLPDHVVHDVVLAAQAVE